MLLYDTEQLTWVMWLPEVVPVKCLGLKYYSFFFF